MTLEEIPKPNIFNDRADFLRYTVGVNAIPFNTKTNTCPLKTWKEFQYRAVTEDEHNEWKRNKMFDNGIAIMLGKVWHRKGFENYFIFAIDCDNQLATDEICIMVKDGEVFHTTLIEWSKCMIVEQHGGDLSKCHLIAYSKHQFKSFKCNAAVVPAGAPRIEVLADSKYLINMSPSFHKDGTNYATIFNGLASFQLRNQFGVFFHVYEISSRTPNMMSQIPCLNFPFRLT